MKTKTLLIAMVLLLVINWAWAQTTTSVTYTGGDVISPLYPGATTSTYCSNQITLTVSLPIGVKITSVDVSYNMTSSYGGATFTQASYLKCSTPGGLSETSMTNGYDCGAPLDQPHTCIYNRTGLTIANNVSGGNVEFQLHHFIGNNYGGTTKVDNNTFTITVHHSETATPSSFSVIGLDGSTLQLSWDSSSPVLLAYNTSDSFIEPTDGVSYTTGSSLGTATILYIGDLQEYIHNDLDSLLVYYYKIWSYSDSHGYSGGASAYGSPASPFSFPFEENFGGAVFPPVGWTVTHITGATSLVWANYSPGYDGGNCARYPSSARNPQSGLLITPAITFNKTRYRLSFWMFRQNSNNTTYLKVLLNSSMQSTGGTEIAHINNRYSLDPFEQTPGWHQYSYELEVNPNDVKYLIFLAYTTLGGADIKIDQLSLEELADFPEGEETAVEDITINPSEDIDLVAGIDETSPIITNLPNFEELGAMRVLGLSGTGNSVDISVTAPAGSWYGSIYYGGAWHQSDPIFIGELDIPRVFTFMGVDFTAKAGEVIILLSEGEASTLPVTLSSFNATITAQNYVKLNWISESETNMLGYRIYRSESVNQSDATMITPTMIYATNTSSTANYSHEDKEVCIGNTYYYWLEGVDMTESQFFGPCQILVQGENTPPIDETQVTSMSNAYPNPFKISSGTNINVQVKTGESGYVKIYNIHGQVVKTIKIKEGFNPVSWDGRDSHDRPCGSGVYYYRLSTNSINKTMKMVLIK